jgi:hypothetical protein
MTQWMIRDFLHSMGTDDQVDHNLRGFNLKRRISLPDTWNEPPSHA